ncbi:MULTISPECIES: non-ribosomal peptide synthetase [Streptomycetaceae]|uniref:non-ribosomal peptide synthetase n=1 Tax=Streptomyces sp. SID5468 TaxID=2690295 RepID=UPI0019289BBC|nr:MULTISPECIES: non-ribosomal peptide synthetase [Streptomycetaceae]
MTLPELFEAQVRRTPDAVAVSHRDVPVTYRELDERANRLARLLLARGIGAEDCVAVALPRTVDHVVALLAVTKSGAAYLPVGLDYPAERIAYILADADPAALLVMSDLAVDEAFAARRVVLDDPDLAARLAGLAAQPLDPAERAFAPRPANPAYVTYTSGSTGRPKAVVIEHRALADYLSWARREYPSLGEGGTSIWHSPSTFDMSVSELWAPLVSGGRVLLAGLEEDADAGEVSCTFLKATPSHLPLLELLPDAFSPTGVLMLGGEALHDRALTEWRRRHPGATVINVYGPTEVTVNMAEFRLAPGEPAPEGVLPLGRVMDNMRGYVLDEALCPVAPGVTGELYVAGAGLARGYAGRPELTAERFVADPFGAPGDRMYRTGDLARWSEDGLLEFRGRVDHQVKVRGFRVEPGEIEAVLARHPAVARAVVLVREDRAGDQRVVAYLTADGTAPDADALRAHVAAELPHYMVPSAFVVLDAFPLTPNAKVDRAALPAPEFTGAEDGRAPRTATEETLCALVAEVLGVGAVSVDDDFFRLGGHSLLAMRLVSRVRGELGVELPVGAVFATPTVAGLAAAVAGAGQARPALVPMARPERVPLSYAQSRMWFTYRLEGPSPTYNIPLALRLSGALDADALVAAVGDVVGRHEALRTRFAEADGEPYQVVLDPASVPEVERAEVAEAELAAALTERAGYRFDLAAEVPLRVSLLRVAEDEHVLLWLVHHIASDGWSLAPLARDLSVAYQARRAGAAPAWQPLPVGYADYALWQRDVLGAEDDAASLAARQLDYWKRQLAGSPELLELPSDRPRPAVASHRGDTVRYAVDPALHARLVELARQTDTTVFMVVQAAIAALLSRVGAGTDIPIGAAVAGRTDEALEDLVGFFVNTVVLRTDVSGDPTFRELLARVRGTDLAAFAHQDVPFERVVEAVNPGRSLSHTPLFQTILTSQNTPADAFTPDGLTVTEEHVARGTARFDLSFHILERAAGDGRPDGIEGWLEYAADLFDPATADALTARLVRLLAAVAAEPDTPVTAVEILSADERRDLLHTWQGISHQVSGRPLPDLVEERVRRTPDALAVVHQDTSLTYRELDERANRLARLLVSRGLGPERYAAVALPRSVDLVVTLLAVTKTGGAYLPLDPGYPADRLAFMLADVDPVLVVTAGGVLDHVAADRPVLRLDDPATTASLAALPADRLTDADRLAPLRLDNAAFTIFTSGSTGRPKGVTVQHRSLDGYLSWVREAYPAVAGRALVHSPVAFDLTVTGLFAPLTAGGCVELTELTEASRVTEGQRRPTFVKATPSHLPLLISLPGEFSPSEQLVLGGESLMGDVLDEWRARNPGATVINEYGPTETTVGCSEFRVAPGDPVPAGVVTIGRPIWNTRMYVLDARLRPVPAGTPGELYIAGDLVTRGYLGRPELTAGRFVADPYGAPGERMYRSGDLARRRADGQLEFIARVDDQVKLRGFRIELGEIEGVMGAHPELAQVAVVVREDRPGDKRLVGYAVPAPGASPDPEELRRHAAAALPDYMVPAVFVLLPELPLTPNRKLDRKALPVPDYGTARTAGRGPRDSLEEILCGAFAEVLGVNRVGVDDNFFDLGGHSLLATRLTARLRGTLGAELSIRALFETPTVAGLAARLADGDLAGAGVTAARPPLLPMARPERVPLSYAQRRLWFIHRLQGSSVTYNIPTWLRLTGRVDADALSAAVTDLVARHEILRTVYPEDAGEPYQQVLAPGELRPEVAFVPVADERRLTEALAEAALHPFGLVGELPLKATLFSLSETEHVLAVVMHHIASDGWSMAPLARDLSAAYRARVTGTPPRWQPLPVQYADYALWQRDLLGTEDDPDSLINRQLKFWTGQLAGAPELLELPLDRPRPAVASHHGGTVELELDPALHRELVSLAQKSGVTLFMVLHAAIATLVSRLGAGTDIPLGTGAAGRTDEALDDLIGFFINTLVLRTDLSGDPTFRELLARCRTTDLAAYAHQDVPFDRVVEAVNPDRALSHSPFVQVALSLNSYDQGVVDFPGVTATSPTVTNEIAKFDLIFFWEERHDAEFAPDGLGLTLKYATDLFDHETGERIADRLVRVLRTAVAEPERRVGTFDVLTAGERDRLLAAGTGAIRPDLAELPLPELFARRAAAAPDAPALVHRGETLSYAEVARRSARLARLLLARGVRRESLVALALPKSAELITAMLAVQRAGGAYLPVDPEYPAERIAYMLDDAAPVCVVTRDGVELPPVECARVVLDDEAVTAELAGLDDTPVTDAERGGPLDARHPAYVIYTSGSTGRPKGVVVTHRGLAPLAASAADAYQIEPDSRVLQLVSPSFDASVLEIVMALATGAALVVPDTHPLAGEALAATLAEQRITHAVIPPAALASIPEDAELPCLRTIVTGSDNVSADLAARWAKRHRVSNSYGPTEATVVSTVGRPLTGEGTPPIGGPLDHGRAYVLDAGMRPVPVGVPGELYVSGAGLARGYLGRPALTAERFVADPFGGPGGRLYRTGDLVRWRPDSQLEFIGRTDDQVKVRGFRIELGEIEAVLDAHPATRRSVALVREDRSGDKRIVGYVEPADGATEAARLVDELLEHCSARLPGYMVPSALVVLDQWPLTPNGKVDRKALPEPGRPVAADSGRAPRDAREETLCAIFAELLEVERVGIDDNFFKLGGHSLLATRLISRVRAALGAEITVRTIFENPTVAELAQQLDGARRARPSLRSMRRRG